MTAISMPHTTVRREPVGLTHLHVGDLARFHTSLLARTDLAVLEALGMTAACQLRVCQVGDPWILQIRATRIGIAETVARAIFVLPENPG